MSIIKSFKSLTKFELCLWIFSLAGVVISAFINGFEDIFTMSASLVGVTALIFVAKGYVLGQALTVVFGVLYGFISYTFSYYGEMITYLCMTAPIAAMAVVSWIRNPYEKGKQEVKVNHLKRREFFVLPVVSAAVTIVFYFILKYFNTSNLPLSTLSVATSFIASYLTFRRSPFYALAYAANDIVLVGLWIYACFYDIRYLSMVICFIMFLINDVYGYVNWSRMKKRQTQGK